MTDNGRSPHSRQEPSASAAHAGICVGATRKRVSGPSDTANPGSASCIGHQPHLVDTTKPHP